MSAQILISPAIISSNLNSCFEGIPINVTIAGLEAKQYELELKLMTSVPEPKTEQPMMIVYDSNPEATIPYNFPIFSGSATKTTHTFSYDIRLQDDQLFQLGYELRQRNTASDPWTVIQNEEQNNFIISCGGTAKFLTPTPTTTEIAQLEVFNINEVVEKDEIVFEERNDPYIESEIPVSFGDDNRVYIRRPGDDLIKVVELNESGESIVVDYLIVPSQTPTPTVTNTSTTTPTPTPTDVFQKMPFLFSFDTANNLFTISISTIYLRPPVGNTENNVNTIQFKFNNLKLISPSSIVTEPNVSDGLALPPSLINNGIGFVIANNQPLFTLRQVDKLKITIPYDPTQTDVDNVSITSFQITDGDNDYSLKDVVFKVNNDGSLSTLLGLYNFIPTGSDTTVGALQINFNSQIELQANSIVSTFPAELNEFTIKSQTSRAIAFADGSIDFDKMSYFEIITEYNAASTNLSNVETTNLILADGNDQAYANRNDTTI